MTFTSRLKTWLGGFVVASMLALGAVAVDAQVSGSQFVVTSGTQTTNLPVFQATQTWNAGGVSFQGLLLTVTDTASAAGSHVIDLIGGAGGVTNLFNVTKAGAVAAASTFSGTTYTATATTNQLILGTTNTVTISSTAPAGSRTYTLPDAGASATIPLVQNFPAALQNGVATYVSTAAPYTNATNTFSTVTGLSWAIAANQTQVATCSVGWQNNGATTDLKWQVTGPSAPTAVNIMTTHVTTNAATGVFANNITTAFSTPYDPNATLAGSAQNYTDRITISVVNGANAGTVAVQAADHTNASGSITIAQGMGVCIVQ